MQNCTQMIDLQNDSLKSFLMENKSNGSNLKAQCKLMLFTDFLHCETPLKFDNPFEGFNGFKVTLTEYMFN